jgi:hypothetical protein
LNRVKEDGLLLQARHGPRDLKVLLSFFDVFLLSEDAKCRVVGYYDGDKLMYAFACPFRRLLQRGHWGLKP